MDKQPVGTLPDLTASSLDDEIMIITDSEHNQLKKEKISDFITDLTSTNENNALTKGTDGKMFVTDFGNASNITEGTLPTSVLPEIPLEKIPDIPKDKLPSIETSDLPVSGVTADTYAYPSSVTVNAQGQVTAIEEGSPSGANANTDLSNLTEEGEKHFLNKTQITNCILEAPNGVATYSDSTLTIKGRLKYLTGNGRNIDKTLKNIEHTFASDKSCTFVGLGEDNGVLLIVDGTAVYCPKSYVYKSNKQPIGLDNGNQVWFNIDTNEVYWSVYPTTTWVKKTDLAVVAEFTATGTTITSFTPYQPVELLKRSDKAEIVSWGMPDYSAGIYKAGGQFSQNYTPPADGVLCWEKLNNDNYVSITSGAQSILYIRGQGYSGLASGQCFCIGGVVHQFFNCNITYFPMKGVNIND